MSLRENAVRRQSRIPLRSKVAWAVYRKKDFGIIVEDIGEFMQSLVNLFPAAIPMQQELVTSEVASIHNFGDLQTLVQMPKQDDLMLQDAVKYKLGKLGSVFNELKAEGSSNLHASDDFTYGIEGRNHIYNGRSSTDNATAHFGNVYRGKDSYKAQGTI